MTLAVDDTRGVEFRDAGDGRCALLGVEVGDLAKLGGILDIEE